MEGKHFPGICKSLEVNPFSKYLYNLTNKRNVEGVLAIGVGGVMSFQQDWWNDELQSKFLSHSSSVFFIVMQNKQSEDTHLKYLAD